MTIDIENTALADARMHLRQQLEEAHGDEEDADNAAHEFERAFRDVERAKLAREAEEWAERVSKEAQPVSAVNALRDFARHLRSA